MKEEIILLREELARAQVETQLLTPRNRTAGSDDTRSIKSSSDGRGIKTGNSSDGESQMLQETRKHLEELEERLNQSQLKLCAYSECLGRVREKLAVVCGGGEGCEERGVGGGGVGRMGEKEKRELEECLNLLTSCSDKGSAEFMGIDPLASRKAEETISLLRSELEQCRVDLCTDEQVFAEKMEEVAELQSTCSVLAREKERAEAMWLAAQESEADLQVQVEQMAKKLVALDGGEAGGGAGEEGVARAQDSPVEGNVVTTGEMGVAIVKGRSHEAEEENANGSSLEEQQSDVSADSLAGGVSMPLLGCVSTSLSLEQQNFEATRSLIKGKVKTSSLEVRDEVLRGIKAIVVVLLSRISQKRLSWPPCTHSRPV